MFYDNLKRICDIKKEKITPLVKKCGGSTGSISKWRNGAYPNSDIVIKIAMHLGVSTDYLLMGEEKSHSPELTSKEQEALKTFKELHKDDQILAIGYMQGLAAKYDHEAEAKENAS